MDELTYCYDRYDCSLIKDEDNVYYSFNPFDCKWYQIDWHDGFRAFFEDDYNRTTTSEGEEMVKRQIALSKKYGKDLTPEILRRSRWDDDDEELLK